MNRFYKFGLLFLGITALCIQTCGAESVEELLSASQASILKTRTFSVEYEATTTGTANWGLIRLKGSLFFESDKRYFLTNTGGMGIFLANYTWVSDGKDFLSVLFIPGNRITEPRKSIEWEPGRTGPLKKEMCVKLIVREGVTSIMAAFFQDLLNKKMPDHNSDSLSVYPASTNQARRISDGQFLTDDLLPSGVTRHIKYVIHGGTNEVELVELWIDAKSLLPVKRISVPPKESEFVETYSWKLNPKLTSDFFDPKRIVREQNLERKITEAEKPDFRLLKAAQEADEALAKEALEAGANPNAQRALVPGANITALMLAAGSGNLNIIQRLVKAGADVNAQGQGGNTALKTATRLGHTAIADYLREHGAKP